jgi:ABC-type branched-subunit amino acid transport system substrate-binding protein
MNILHIHVSFRRYVPTHTHALIPSLQGLITPFKLINPFTKEVTMKKKTFWIGILLVLLLTVPSMAGAQKVGYNPTRALTNLQEMKGKIFAVCGLLGTAVLNATKDFFPENKLVSITPYGDVRIWARTPKDKLRYIFVAYTDYEDEAEYLAKYAMNNLASKKIAVFYQNDDYGKMGLVGVRKGLAAMPGKAKLVGSVPYGVTERALGTHALNLKETGADAVIVYSTMTHGALIVKEMAKIGYRPKVLVTFPLGDPIMYKIAGEVWEGTYIALPGNSGVPGSEPEADKVVKILKKYNPKLAGKEYLALFGSISMMHLIEGLKNAGPNLTTESMIKGMEKIKNWRPEGIAAPVTYGI